MSNPRNINNNLYQIRLPLIISISLTVGLLVGSQFFGSTDLNVVPASSKKNAQKLEKILNYIDRYYVDEVDVDQLTEKAIEGILKELDPHTSYIPPRHAEMVNSHLQDGFDGIGIEFAFIRDTIRVLTVVGNGPADTAGLKPGDKILFVDGMEMAGSSVENDVVVNQLRGKKGSKVEVGVKRKGHEVPLFFQVTRGKIPTPTIEFSYMPQPETGFIKLDRFGSTTHEEFKEQLESLKAKGMKKLILDLRDNGGGYLSEAIKIADELLPGNILIVATDGRGDAFDQQDFAGKEGEFEEGGLVVLINEQSASASEVLSGALQDHDRALVIGRRSFGKGLVQRQIDLGDNSYLRMTISKYFTPTGRSIQKPFDSYENDLSQRYENGEYFHEDSVSVADSLLYTTDNGRKVYGGGGIMPDMFVAYDTSYYSETWKALIEKDLIRDFAIDYAASEAGKLLAMGAENFVEQFKVTPGLMDSFWKHSNNFGVEKGNIQPISEVYLKTQLKAHIGRALWRESGYYPVVHQSDQEFKKALAVIDSTTNILASLSLKDR